MTVPFFEGPLPILEHGTEMARPGLADAEAHTALHPPELDVRAAFFEHGERVRRFVERLGHDRPDAEDLMSETFLVAHTRRADFDPSRPVLPWLFGIAARLSRRQRRRLWVRRMLGMALVREAQEEPRAPDLEAGLVEAEDAARVRRALAKLPARKRELLVLREYESLSTAEIAEALGIPEGTVHSALHHARKELLRVYRQAILLEEAR